MKKITFFLFLFASILVNAQTFTLSGKVVDENNKPLAGASVLLKKLKKELQQILMEISIKLPKGTLRRN